MNVSVFDTIQKNFWMILLLSMKEKKRIINKEYNNNRYRTLFLSWKVLLSIQTSPRKSFPNEKILTKSTSLLFTNIFFLLLRGHRLLFFFIVLRFAYQGETILEIILVILIFSLNILWVSWLIYKWTWFLTNWWVLN